MTSSSPGATGKTWGCVVLAAGRGSRMGTALPKPLHEVGGTAIIQRVLNAVAGTGITDTTVVRDDSGAIPEALGLVYRYITQNTPDGTGGAIKAYLADTKATASHLLVINGDLPLITDISLRRLVEGHESRPDVSVTFFTMQTPKSASYGRIRRFKDGKVAEIVESVDPYFGDAPPEGNAGVYALDLAWARSAVERLPQHEDGEYYITDLVKLAVADGRGVETLEMDAEEAIGVNTLVDLAEAERVAQRRTLEALMLSGVTIIDPASTYIDATVTIAADTVVRPNTHITGVTTIGAGCEIGPDAHIFDSEIGERCVVRGSWLDEVDVGG